MSSGASRVIYTTIPDDGIVDDVAIERVLKGHPAALSKAEKLEVVRRGIMRDGLSIVEIEERIGLASSAISHMVKRYTGKGIAEFLGPTYELAAVKRGREKFEGLPRDIQMWHKWHPPQEREKYNAKRREDRAAKAA